MKFLENWQLIIGIIIALVSTSFAVDARYAKDNELAALQQDFQQYKAEQELDRVQHRIWDTQDRLNSKTTTFRERADLTDRLRELSDIKDRLLRQIGKKEQQR